MQLGMGSRCGPAGCWNFCSLRGTLQRSYVPETFHVSALLQANWVHLTADPDHRQPPQAGWAQPSLLLVFPCTREEDESPASLLIASCCGVVGVELTNTPDRTQIIGRSSTRGHLSLPASEAAQKCLPSAFAASLSTFSPCLLLPSPGTWSGVLGSTQSGPWLLY